MLWAPSPRDEADLIRTALFDIDGTLLHGRPIAHGLAMVAGLNRCFGLDLVEGDLLRIDLSGKTDLQIATELLDRAGVATGGRDDGLRRWCASAAREFAAIADRHPDPDVAPDAAHTLGRLADGGVLNALVTGNIEAIAHAKMARAGLGAFFTRGHGGFGCDSVVRTELVLRALERASVPADDAVVVGDTPRDIAAAHGAGCRVIAVTTGFASAQELVDADAVVPTLSALPAVLGRWWGVELD